MFFKKENIKKKKEKENTKVSRFFLFVFFLRARGSEKCSPVLTCLPAHRRQQQAENAQKCKHAARMTAATLDTQKGACGHSETFSGLRGPAPSSPSTELGPQPHAVPVFTVHPCEHDKQASMEKTQANNKCQYISSPQKTHAGIWTCRYE